MIATIAKRKERRLCTMRSAVEHVEQLLATYARGHDGRFVVFGSVARGDIHHDSDFDLPIDFPPEREREARGYAEAICMEHGVRPDLHLRPDVSARLLEHIERDGRLIS